jgi:hypothetical protein
MLRLEPLKLVHALMALEWRAEQPNCLRTRYQISEDEQVNWWKQHRQWWFTITDDGTPIGYTGFGSFGTMPELSFLITKSAWDIWQEAFDLVIHKGIKADFFVAEVYLDSETLAEWTLAARRYSAGSVIFPRRKKTSGGDFVDSLLIVFNGESFEEKADA